MLRSISEFYKQRKKLIGYILIASVITLSLNCLLYRNAYSNLVNEFNNFVILHKKHVDLGDKGDDSYSFEEKAKFYNLSRDFFQLSIEVDDTKIFFLYSGLKKTRQNLSKASKIYSEILIAESTRDEDGYLTISEKKYFQLMSEGTAYEEETLKKLKTVSNNPLFWDYRKNMRIYTKLFNEWHKP